MTKDFNVSVSMNQAAPVKTGVVLKQGDFGFDLKITVLDFTVTGTTPQIVFRKPMGAVESTDVTASGNVYTYTFKGTELDTPGKVFCDLKLKNSTTQRISTASFQFECIADTLDGLTDESSSYSDTVAQIVAGFDNSIGSLAPIKDKVNVNQGNAYASSGEYVENDSPTRIRSEKFKIVVEEPIKVKDAYKDTYCFHYCRWQNGVFDSGDSTAQLEIFRHPIVGAEYVIVVKAKASGVSIVPSEFFEIMEDNNNFTSAEVYRQHQTAEKEAFETETRNFETATNGKIDAVSAQAEINQGNAYASSGEYVENDSSTRIRSEKFKIVVEEPIEVKDAYKDTYCFHYCRWQNGVFDSGDSTKQLEILKHPIVGAEYVIVVKAIASGVDIAPSMFYTVMKPNVNFNSPAVYDSHLTKRFTNDENRILNVENKLKEEYGIYGIEFYYSADDPACERIYDAAGLNNDIYDGVTETYRNNGHNDFDNIYPWSDIKRCNVSMRNGKPYAVYEGTTSYDPNGNVMVEIPDFWISRKRDMATRKEQWLISQISRGGFIHIPKTYIGAYHGSASQDAKFSKTGATPLTSHYMFSGTEQYPGSFWSDYQTAGYLPYDFITRMALQFLISIEFNSVNLSRTHNIGGFEGIPYGWGGTTSETRCRAVESETNANRIKTRCYDDSHDFHYYEQNGIGDSVQKNPGHFCIGDTIAILASDEYQKIEPRKITNITYDYEHIVGSAQCTAIIEFDGEPVDIVEDDTCICGNPQFTGNTDDVYAEYHTAIQDRESTYNNANVQSWCNHFRHWVYRGIEDPWGNIYTLCVGIGCAANVYKYTFDTSDYNSANLANWEPLTYGVPDVSGFTDATTGLPYWIYRFGIDVNNPAIMMPSMCNGSGENENLHGLNGEKAFGDTFRIYSNVATYRTLMCGGGYDHTFRGGLFMCRFASEETEGIPYWLNGCRPIVHVLEKEITLK